MTLIVKAGATRKRNELIVLVLSYLSNGISTSAAICTSIAAGSVPNPWTFFSWTFWRYICITLHRFQNLPVLTLFRNHKLVTVQYNKQHLTLTTWAPWAIAASRPDTSLYTMKQNPLKKSNCFKQNPLKQSIYFKPNPTKKRSNILSRIT